MSDLSWIDLSKKAIHHNLQVIRSCCAPQAKLCACIKGNAYGHGLDLMAEVLVSGGIDWLAVYTVKEFRQLRELGITCPIVILGYVPKDDLGYVIAKEGRLWGYDIEFLREIQEISAAIDKPAYIHLVIETGMGRLGLYPEDIHLALDVVEKAPKMVLEGVTQHFSTADDSDPTYYRYQESQFKQGLAVVLNKYSRESLIIHIQNSAGIMYQSPSIETDMIRSGAALYGLAPNVSLQKHEIQPVLTWKSRLISVKVVKKGSSVSYGATHTLSEDTLIGVIPVGYADGYPRRLSGKSEVLVQGVRCPVIGRVCMNMIMVDLSSVPQAKPGHQVTLIGRDGEEEITIQDLAGILETIPYEITTRISPLIPRRMI